MKFLLYRIKLDLNPTKLISDSFFINLWLFSTKFLLRELIDHADILRLMVDFGL